MTSVQNVNTVQVQQPFAVLKEGNVYSTNFKAGSDQFVRQPSYVEMQREREKQMKKQSLKNKIISGLGVAVSVVVLLYFGLALKDRNALKRAAKTGGDAMSDVGSSSLRELNLSGANGLDNPSMSEELKAKAKKIKLALKKRAELEELGRNSNLNIMLYGEPGGGKTDFVKSLGEYYKEIYSDAKIFELDPTATGSMFKDAAEKNVMSYIENVIKYAKEHKDSRVVLFIDEFDTFAQKDFGPNAPQTSKMQNVFKRIFQAMNQPNVDVIMATNKANQEQALETMLDSAIISRINEYIYVPLPNAKQFVDAFVKDMKKIPGQRRILPELTDISNPELQKLCGWLAKPEHKASFREKNKIFDGTLDAAVYANEVITDTPEALERAYAEGKIEKVSIKHLKESAAKLAKEKHWDVPEWLTKDV